MAREYELVYILNPTIGEEEQAALNDRINNLVEANGTVVSVDDWGNRRLAYEIQDLKEGHYYLVNFTAETDGPREIERILRILDGILRFLIIRKED
ncbi:MAG: 30S ribosomal protein S6 [Fastidiosipilaceae bacterium]|nr:30S ribosomal protein S6 [Clostridiaceae bacterium]